MAELDASIFIDAQQYLDLYRVTKGKKLLDPLREQREYIYVTAQIVDEVQRNKLSVAAEFLSRQLEELKVRGFDIPDHLFDTTSATAAKLRETLKNIGSEVAKVNEQLKTAAIETLNRISLSQDEVSRVLDTIFQTAVTHAPDELERARDRKERGNPPGKKSDPLGDQLSWEQLLSHSKTKRCLWIITRDSDFCVTHSGKTFLNAFLQQDLARAREKPIEVRCFASIDDGIRDFVKSTGVKAENLPTDEESKQIKDELTSLPPLGWLNSAMGISSYLPQRAWDQRHHPGYYSYYTNVSNPSLLFSGVVSDDKKSD